MAGALLVAGACGGSDGDVERLSPSATKSTSAPASSTRVTPRTAATALASPTDAVPTTTTTTTTTTTVQGVSRATAGTSRPSPTVATTSGTPLATGLTFTVPGTYRYATTGRFTSALTGTEARDGESTLTVEPSSGTDQRSVDRGPGRTAEQVLRLDGSGAYLVSLRLADQGIDKEVRPVPPVLALPADAAPGRAWAWRATSTDGQTTVDSSFKAVRTEDVTVGSERVPTLVVEIVLTFTGDIVSTSGQTMWISPARRLVVRQDEATDGRLGLITFSSTSSETLLSLTPG